MQVPSLCEDLLSSVDQPLKIARDKETGKDYLLCDYNRDGDSYRSASPLVVATACPPPPPPLALSPKPSPPLCLPSRSPWSNKYDPSLPDGAVPSDRLRRLEVEANQAFDTYREL